MLRTNRVLLAGLAVATIIVLLVSAVGYRALRLAGESSRSVAHTQQVLKAIEGILSDIFDAEAATRTYENTGDGSSLGLVTHVERSLPVTLNALSTLTTDNIAQQQRIPELRRRVAETLGALHQIITKRAVGALAARAEIDRENASSDGLRETLGEMRLEEQRLLERRIGDDERAIRSAQGAVLSVVGISCPLLASAFVLLVRGADKVRQLNGALQRANEDLETRVSVRTVDLGRALAGEREARREAQEANRLKDDFLMTVSHELRTPLTALYGWARMLVTGEIREGQQQRALEAIERNAAAQTQLVNDLIDVSSAISGKLRLDIRTVDMRSVIAAAIDTVQPSADAKNIRIETMLNHDAGPIAGDPNRLQQVVWNLLSNAIKFTPKGGRVRVHLTRENSRVELAVSDSGPGIAPDFLPYAFDRFRQGQTGTTRAHSGLGLGLAIVRHLVEAHGGSVRAENGSLDAGATVRVMLPLTIAGEDVSQRLTPIPAGPGVVPVFERLDGLRVLIVDDEPQARNLFSVILETAGAEVRSASSAREALALIEVWPPAVLVSDIEMPNEDGYMLMRKVRESSAPFGMVSIAVTAHARFEDKSRALRAGFQAHLAKPIEPSELISVIAGLTSRDVSA